MRPACFLTRVLIVAIGSMEMATLHTARAAQSSALDASSIVAVRMCGDLDGDGLPDAIAVRASGVACVLKNRGDGTFVSATTGPTPAALHLPAPPPTPYCVPDITDQAMPSTCMFASSTPTLGMLYPISSNWFVSAGGSVGIGTTSPTSRLHVTTNGSSAFESDATATSGVTYAGQFMNASTSGVGVFALASTTSGLNYGGWFVSNSANGTGVRGETLSTTSGGAGVYGQSAGLSGFGVYGSETNASGAGYGVLGSCSGIGGTGVAGNASHASGTNYAIYGTTSSPNGYAGYFTGGRNYFQGNVGIGQTNPAHPIDLASGAHCTSGGVWTNASSRALKENIESVDARGVLEKLSSLPIATWNYKIEGRGVQHIGPMADDFAHTFQVGADCESIGTVDADGVALAAIQGLHDVVREQQARIAEQESRMLRQEKTIEALVHRIDALERVSR